MSLNIIGMKPRALQRNHLSMLKHFSQVESARSAWFSKGSFLSFGDSFMELMVTGVQSQSLPAVPSCPELCVVPSTQNPAPAAASRHQEPTAAPSHGQPGKAFQSLPQAQRHLESFISKHVLCSNCPQSQWHKAFKTGAVTISSWVRRGEWETFIIFLLKSAS